MSEQGSVPSNLRYSKDHEWVRVEGDMAVVGISDHAQHALGEITYVDLPAAGKKVAQHGELAAVESAKAASDVFAPIGGVVAEVNEALNDTPEKVNADPYGEGWLCKIKDFDKAGLDALLTPEQYKELLEQES